jgi:hypothetical protein
MTARYPSKDPSYFLVRNLERRHRLLEKFTGIPKNPLIVKNNFAPLLQRIYTHIWRDLNRQIKSGSLTRKDAEMLFSARKGEVNQKLFTLLNRAAQHRTKPDTSPATGLYARAVAKIADLPSIQEIIAIASRPDFKLVTGMQNGLGMPDLTELEALSKWCNDHKVELRSVTGMQHGLGMPNLTELEALSTWCTDHKTKLEYVAKSLIGKGIPKNLDELF